MSKPANVGTKTCEVMRLRGFLIEACQVWNSWSGTRKDLFGLFDYMAVHPEARGIVGVQTSTMTNLSGHVRKAHEQPALVPWLASGGRFVLHMWAKPGHWVAEKRLWTLLEIELGLVDGSVAEIRRETFDGKGRPVAHPIARKKVAA